MLVPITVCQGNTKISLHARKGYHKFKNMLVVDMKLYLFRNNDVKEKNKANRPSSF
jgi:hypothetical protein